MRHGELLLLGLRTLLTVLGTGLHTAIHTLGIERTADDVVTHAGEVLDTAAADQNDGVLLQVVAVRRTRAILRRAEFGFFGVVVLTAVQTPLFWGEDRSVARFFRVLRPFCSAGAVDL